MSRLQQLAGMILVLLWLAGCSGLKAANSNGGGNSGGSGGQAVTVSITAPSYTVAPFGTVPFTVSVSGTSNTAVTWQVNNVTGGSQKTGLISTSGVYSAPQAIDPSLVPSNTSATVTVTAVSQASTLSSASATLTLITQQQKAQSGAVELGTSGGNINDVSGNFCCGATLGSLVVRNVTYYILSNNHVLATSDNGIPGDAISQPGIIDSPSPCTTQGTTTVAHLSEFFNLETGPSPKIDAALAQIVTGMVDTTGNILLLGATETNGVPNMGAPHAGTLIPISVGQSVAKSGRTTGLTCSTVLATNVAANVDYYRNCGDTTKAFTTSYTDLISIADGSFSAGGDSGSLIVTQNTADPVGLLFAGSDTDSVANTMTDVLSAFPGAQNATTTIVGGTTHQVIGCSLMLTPAS